MAVILDFRSEGLQLFLIYKSSRCFLPSFKSIGLSVQETKPYDDPYVTPASITSRDKTPYDDPYVNPASITSRDKTPYDDLYVTPAR